MTEHVVSTGEGTDWLLLTKLIPAVVRDQPLRRSHPFELLERGSRRKMTLVDAPAGWGKTTVVADWISHRPTMDTAWLSLDPEDDDPVRFWTYIVHAIGTVSEAISAQALQRLRSHRSPPAAGVVAALVNGLLMWGRELCVVIDDYHCISDAQIHAAVVSFIDHLPPNVHLVVITRADPPFPVGRWRLRGEMTEIRADDLSFDAVDAAALLNGLHGLDLPRATVAQLHDRTEGWVAGLELAALSLSQREDRVDYVAGFAGDDRHVMDYLGGEVLDSLSPAVREFLVSTSVLERLTGPLCDAVTASSGSSGVLAAVERVNHFLVRLDTRGRWYRWHQLFRELLNVELERTRPDTVADLHRRAAGWFEDNGRVAEAIHHASLAGEATWPGELLALHWNRMLQRGDLPAIMRALEEVGDEAVRRDPRLCLVAAWMTINLGRVSELGHWIAAAEEAVKEWPGGESLAFSAAAAMLRCIESYLGGDAGSAIAAALEARTLQAEEVPPWRSVGCPVLGIALYWAGRSEESCEALERAVPRAKAAGNHLAEVHALGCLALAAAERHDDERAAELAQRAATVSAERGFGDHWAAAMTHLALGRVAAHRGDLLGADSAVSSGVELSQQGLARIELAYGLLALADVRLHRRMRHDAMRLAAEAEQTLNRCPDPGILAALGDATARKVGRRTSSVRVLSAGEDLSPAERGVLALLPTELTLREMAASLFVSMNTIKTQTRAIYRKLGVSNRAEAVSRARQLDLA